MLFELFSRFSKKNDSVLSVVPRINVQAARAADAEAPEAKPVRSGITFAVDDVQPAGKAIWTETLVKTLGWRFKRRILHLPEGDQLVINPAAEMALKIRDEMRAKRAAKTTSQPSPASRWEEEFFSKSDEALASDTGSRCHPLIDAVHTAFSDHRPLVLSPDAIWLVIAQGFSHHVTENAEALRSRLVRHQGKRQLSTMVRDLSVASFENAISSFSAQIREETDAVLHETLICDFSTTTIATRVASEVALMDTFSSYFTYEMMCVCGIPKITLEGTPDDWQRIRARVEVLGTYDLDWWVSRLRPILDEFVLTAQGQPDPEFWKAIYKPAETYGAILATGWITDLFPYLGDKPGRRRNAVLTVVRDGWSLPAKTGVGTKGFPSGISSVPVKLDVAGEKSDVDLVAGFFAVKQNPQDLALSPMIGWSVTEPPPSTPVLVRG